MSLYYTNPHKALEAAANIQGDIIKGVSLVTEGEFLGHDLFADAKTLETVKAAADANPDGVKAKINHGSDAGAIIGVVRDVQIVGNQAKGDLHLLSSSPHKDYVIELATVMPSAFGMSIVCQYTPETIDGKTYVRCDVLSGVDIVDQPAANPNGLFSVEEQRDRAQLQARRNFSALIEAHKERDEAKAQLIAARAELAAAVSARDAIRQEFETYKADEPVRINAAAARVLASAGHPTVDIGLGDFDGAPQRREPKGLERVRAAFRKEQEQHTLTTGK